MKEPGTTRTHRCITCRLLPVTRANARALSRLAGGCRFVWNQALADTEDLYRISRMVGAPAPSLTFFSLGKAFTDMRRATPWLAELPFGVVRHTLKRQADAWRRFFRGQGGRPRFRGRYGDDGFTIPDRVRIAGGRLHIPKVGWVVLRRRGGNPYPGGEPRQVYVRRALGKWCATVSHEVDAQERPDDGLAVGVDMNVGQVAASTGEILRAPDAGRLEARRRRCRRMVSRRQKGSKRRDRARRLLARASRKLAMRRRNWHPRGIPASCRQRAHGLCGGVAGAGHDGFGPGNRGGAGTAGEGEGRAEPVDSCDRLG